jgi:methylthioribose-1-phosphate isomerase
MLKTIEWTGEAVRVLDQTRLPGQIVYLELRDERQVWDAIPRLVVRGAPLIGVSAAYGVVLGVRAGRGVDAVCDYLATSRPTAVNLFWALDRMRRVAKAGGDADRLLAEAHAIRAEDEAMCLAIGQNGVTLFANSGDRPVRLLTHCNAGALATAGIGTALAPIYAGLQQGLKFEVFADETRPLHQGSRLTALELREAGVPVTVLCDNMAATVLAQRKVDAVIVGADRIAANGDTANKIGTMPLAIVSHHFGIPFYVAAPTSTIDPSLPDGSHIPIEQRDPAEITGTPPRATAPDGVKVFNPAFDVTPAALITAIITERAVHRPPYRFKKL